MGFSIVQESAVPVLKVSGKINNTISICYDPGIAIALDTYKNVPKEGINVLEILGEES
jgi:hypothetical protein